MSKAPIAALAAVLASAATAHADPVVRTKQGLVQGFVSGAVEQFRGVPYATPPLGELRWRAPLPAQPWSGVRPATSFAAPCIQARQPAGLPTISEDCLYLNVYRPAGAREHDHKP